MSAYLKRVLLGALPEVMNLHSAKQFYNDPEMQTGPAEYGVDGLKIGSIPPERLGMERFMSAKATGSVLFGYPCIIYNSASHNEIDRGSEFILRHEISHIKNADVDKIHILFGVVAASTSMMFLYFGILAGAKGRMRRIWNVCCKEGFAITLGLSAKFSYSRKVEARADADAASQISKKDVKEAIEFFSTMQKKNIEQLGKSMQQQIESVDKIEKGKLEDIRAHYSPLVQDLTEQAESLKTQLKSQEESKTVKFDLENQKMCEGISTFEGITDQLNERYILANTELSKLKTAQDKEIEKVRKACGNRKNGLNSISSWISFLEKLAISPEGDDRLDVMHPPLSSRIRNLEKYL